MGHKQLVHQVSCDIFWEKIKKNKNKRKIKEREKEGCATINVLS